MKHFWLGILVGILVGTFAYTFAFSGEVKTGYFITTLEDIPHEQTYKEITSYKTVDVYAELTDKEIAEKVEPKVIDQKEVPVYTLVTDSWVTKRPALGIDLRNWQKVGTYGESTIFYVVTSDKALWETISKHADYIGSSIRDICLKAGKDKLYLPIAQRLLYNRWDTGLFDKDKNKVTKRGSMADWIAADKPKLLGKRWVPKMVFSGVPCPLPIVNTEVNEIDVLVK